MHTLQCDAMPCHDVPIPTYLTYIHTYIQRHADIKTYSYKHIYICTYVHTFTSTFARTQTKTVS